MYKYHKKTPEEHHKETEDLTKKIPKQLQEFQNGTIFQNYLDLMSKIHAYSLNNTILIFSQCPDATMVASYTDWRKKYHRNVKLGEHGIKILCPCKKKVKVESDVIDPNTGDALLDANGNKITKTEEKQVTYFRIGTVFDRSQTEQIPGMSIIELDYIHPINGTIDNYNDLMTAVQKAAPVPIMFEQINSSSVNGYFSRIDRKIIIQQNLSEIMKVRCAIHETVHSILHDKPLNKLRFSDGTPFTKEDCEIQAEGTSYCVCQMLSRHFDGLTYLNEVKSYSIPYIAGYNYEQSPEHLKLDLENIKFASEKIYSSMKQSLLQIQQEHEQQTQVLTAPQLTDKLNDFVKSEYSDLYRKETYPSELRDHIFIAVRRNKLDFYENSLTQIAADNSNKYQQEAKKLLKNIRDYRKSYKTPQCSLQHKRTRRI